MTYIKMIKHAGTQTIETARLILRRFEVDDADVMFHNWASDNTVTRYMTWQAHKDTDETKGILQQWIDGYSNENSYHWGISLADSELIGSIGIFVSEEDYSGSIGYCIGQKWWSKGYTSEALKAVIDYMFTNTDIERIHAYHAVENPASGKVMEKAGMEFEGCSKRSFKNTHGFHDSNLYGIIREMWEGKN